MGKLSLSFAYFVFVLELYFTVYLTCFVMRECHNVYLFVKYLYIADRQCNWVLTDAIKLKLV
jgi:hypothetical protein